YIVNAAAEKARAVREAELSAASKYRALLLQFAEGAPAAAPQLGGDAVETPFTRRGEGVRERARAGKSRWGDEENRALSAAPAAPAAAKADPRVEEADHGLRSQGAVGGASLAERVGQGASLPADVGGGSSERVNYGAQLVGGGGRVNYGKQLVHGK
ncbi:hypothetical protein TeGR_g13076, partial [Tetraparma gracilis]